MVEVFAFDVELRPPKLLAEILQVSEGRRTAGVAGHHTHILIPKGGISLRCREGRLQLSDGLVQNFWDKGAAKGPIIALVSRCKLKEFSVHTACRPLLLRNVSPSGARYCAKKAGWTQGFCAPGPACCSLALP